MLTVPLKLVNSSLQKRAYLYYIFSQGILSGRKCYKLDKKVKYQHKIRR